MYKPLLQHPSNDNQINLSPFSAVSTSSSSSFDDQVSSINNANAGHNTNTDVDVDVDDLGVSLSGDVDIDDNDDMSSTSTLVDDEDTFSSIVRYNHSARKMDRDHDGAYHGECPEGYSLDSVILAETGTKRDTCLDLTSVSPVVSACEDGFVFTPATRACHNFTCYLDIVKQRPTLFESYDDYIGKCFIEGCQKTKDRYDKGKDKDQEKEKAKAKEKDMKEWTVIEGEVNIFRLLPLCVLKKCTSLHNTIILGGTGTGPVVSVDTGISTNRRSADMIDSRSSSSSRNSENGYDDDEDDGESVRPFKATTQIGNDNGSSVFSITNNGQQQPEQQDKRQWQRPAVSCVKHPECPEFAYRAGGHCVVDCPTNFKLVDDKCVGEHVNPVCPPGAKLRPWDFLCENIPKIEPSPEQLPPS